MGWTAGSDISTGDLVTSAAWNNYLGASGSLEHVYDTKRDKELWVSVNANWDNGTSSWVALRAYEGYPLAILSDADDEGAVSFKCPSDFTAITKAVLVVRPKATQGAANWDIASKYGAAGQAAGTHAESDTSTTYNVVDEQVYEIDVSGILTSLAADDFVGLLLTNKDASHDVELIGFYMTYT